MLDIAVLFIFREMSELVLLLEDTVVVLQVQLSAAIGIIVFSQMLICAKIFNKSFQIFEHLL